MKPSFIVSLAIGLATATPADAQNASDVPYVARAFNPAHADLRRFAGIPAQLANEEYVEALARIVYYWAYPAIDVTSRTMMWELMKEGPGLMFGIGPGSPVNESGCLSGYLPPTQRIVVTPNNDTFYGVAFLDLGREPVVLQTPTNVPEGHYWVMQIALGDADCRRLYQRRPHAGLGVGDTGRQVPAGRA